MSLVIGVALEVSTASSSPGTMTLQRTFEAAILGFIFGPPELEEKAWKKVQEIIDFASKYKLLGESDSRAQLVIRHQRCGARR